MSTTWVLPVAPVQSDWWNPAVTLANVLATLRLAGGDIDENRLAALIPAAGYKINSYLDATVAQATTGPHIEALQDALEQLVIVMYQPPIQQFDGLSGRTSFVDPIKAVAGILAPKRQRWGVA